MSARDSSGKDYRRYDDRVDDDYRQSRRPPNAHKKRTRRDRSRSRSPTSNQREEARRARMARLRAENEDEERRLAALDKDSEEKAKYPQPKQEFISVGEEELRGMDEEEQMQRLLGFSGGFASTKGEAVEDNTKSAARGAAAKNKARKYRQYMNRKGGFNRPLDKMD